MSRKTKTQSRETVPLAHKMREKSKLQAARFCELLNPLWLGNHDLLRVVELIEHEAASGGSSIEVFNLSGGLVKALRLEKFTVERIDFDAVDINMIALSPQTFNVQSAKWLISW